MVYKYIKCDYSQTPYLVNISNYNLRTSFALLSRPKESVSVVEDLPHYILFWPQIPELRFWGEQQYTVVEKIIFWLSALDIFSYRVPLFAATAMKIRPNTSKKDTI